MANGKITGKDLIDDSAFKVFERLNDEALEGIRNLNNLEKAARNAVNATGLENTSRKAINEIRNTNKALTEQEKVHRQLEIAKKRNTQVSKESISQLITEREKRNQLTRELRQEAKLNQALEGSYKRLRLERDKAGRTLRDLVISEKASNKEIQKAQREFDRLDAKVRKADRSTRNFRDNVGNYGSALGAGIGAFRQFVGVFGAFSALQIASELFNQVKALDALEQSLKAVTETTEQFNESQEFILEIAENYGLEIKSITGEYTKYIASLKGTNLEGEKGQRIFDSLVKVSARLNNTQEQTNGILNAFSQIISKGTVQAEELRGQLGDRLPGAFNIMARAIGVSTEELNDMLKEGEVLAEEVLPKFAVELERTFGTENLNRIDSLVAAQNRLSNEWTKLLSSLTGGNGILKGVFSTTLNFVTSVIASINELGEKLRETFQSEAVKAAKKEYEDFAKVTNDQIKSLNSFTSAQTRLNEALQQSFDLQSNLEGKLISGGFSEGQAKQISDELFRLAQNTGTYNQFLEESTQIIERNDLLSKDYLATLFSRVKGVNSVIDATSEQIAKEKELVNTLNESGKAVEEVAPKLEKVFTILRGSTGQELENTKKELAEIIEILNSSGGGVNVGISGISAPNTEEITKGLLVTIEETYQKVNERARFSAEEQEAVFASVFDTFSTYYNLDLTAFQKLLQDKEASLQDYANSAKSLVGTITDSTLIRYENERQANQENLNAILNSEKIAEEEKLIARKKFDEEDRKLKIKQAKAERTAALIQIAIDTALGIVKAVAASPLTGGLPFSAIVAGIGAAQAAFVAAQPLPQFFKGKNLMDNYEGPATWGERRKEVKIGADGSVEVSPNKTTPLYVKKNDIITPSIDDFNRRMKQPNSEVFRRVSRSLQNDTQKRAQVFMVKNPPIDTTKIEEAVIRGFKKAKITNNININTKSRATKY
ncbi:tape measure protein [Flagellimonas aurea]|uniref:tape measure protein n=1 Tax=Flagellimonas aurea TaxID=2915619 RepID=UPI0035D0922A